ncbi:quinone oxidoreductase family protein [Xanthomonas tesorieronis]|uniref:quinone oxidoreductase family protein n=1 Tax=Xanthomonas tesorieronis TaxID=3160839 RepID=UPI0035136EC9
MRAAIVKEVGSAPVLGDFPDPVPSQGEEVIQVLAAPLSPIVKKLAAGEHYASNARAGFVPGIDGVGINGVGERVYFLFPKPPYGSMAEKALVASTSMVPVPEGVSSELAAAVVTAGLSSWIALNLRAGFQPGETVLINGATGSAGGLAVQIAVSLGARKIFATGRNLAKLDALPAGVTKIALDGSADDALRSAFDRGVDVVLDYLWGEPAARIIAAATSGRGSRAGEPRLRFVQLGSMAGDSIPLSAHAFRSSGLEILGSGIGSVSMTDLVQGARELLAATPAGGFDTPVQRRPLASIHDAWLDQADNGRLVFCP